VTDQARLASKNPAFTFGGGGKMIDVCAGPSEQEAPAGQRRERWPDRVDALLVCRDRWMLAGDPSALKTSASTTIRSFAVCVFAVIVHMRDDKLAARERAHGR